MKDIPMALKVVINVCLYMVYVLFVSIAFSFLFPIFLQILGKELIDWRDPVFVKIQLFIAVLVLLISLILRKYFYISNTGGRETVYVGKEEEKVKKTTRKAPKKTKKYEENDDEEIKIYVEKEIK